MTVSKIPFTKQQKRDIIREYQNGTAISILAKKYNVTYHKIHHMFKLLKIPLDKTRMRVSKYTINHHYFDVIDNEHKAYWLGFLYADGYNSEDKNYIRIHLHHKDVEILINFLRDLNSSHKISYINETVGHAKSCKIEISSKQISKRLAELGCFQKKSLTLKFPTEQQLPRQFISHFLRGLWDGDGEVAITKPWNYPRVALYSSKLLCDELQKILQKSYNVDARLTKMRNPLNMCLYIAGGKVGIKNFLNWLYRDATVKLDRKYQKYLQILEIPNRKKRVQSQLKHPS